MKKYLAVLCGVGILAAGCGTTGNNEASTSANGGVTLTNCGEEVTYSKTDSLFVNDGNIIATALSAGGKDKIKNVSSLQRDVDILKAKYGAETIDDLNAVSKEYPSLEEVVSKQPNVYVAGWGYGLSESKNMTPETLKEQGIGTYLITESCRQQGTDKRGTTDPWTAVSEDLKNIGTLVGNADTARKVVADQDARLKTLRSAEQPEKKPTAFVFDSASDTIFTSGKFGAPQAIIDAAGARNANEDVDDTWTQVGWEKISASAPDVFVFVDYPGQDFQQKVDILKSNPATKDLPAVQENRFINLPYAMWCSGPLNIDAAEHVRKGMEKFNLVPASDITPSLTLPDSVAGQEYVH